MITKKQFKQSLKETLERDFEVHENSIQQINRGLQETFSICKKGEKTGISVFPIIEIDDLYQNFKDGKSIKEIVSELDNSIHTDKKNAIDIKEKIEKLDAKLINFRLINKAQNEDFLEGVPYYEKLDLAIIFNIDLGFGDTIVTNQLLKNWNVSKEKLYDIAYQNLSLDMHSMMDSGSLPLWAEDNIPFVAVSNEKKYYGASVILDTDFLKDITEKIQTSVYIIPSSVHEILILPAFSNEMVKDLKRIVKEMNAEMVKIGVLQKKEVLSNNIYFFDFPSNMLSIV